jgi:hypothetical protein
MKLLRYRVTNFRSVVDSDWIELDRVTALIGVNESGKTNLLLPLWKLNPASEGEISPTSDYPKANYAAIREEPGAYVFVRAELDTSGLASKLSRLTGVPESQFDKVVVGRAFDGSYSLEFPSFNATPRASREIVVALLSSAASEIGAMTALAKEGNLRGCSRSFENQHQERQMYELQAGIEFPLAVLP